MHKMGPRGPKHFIFGDHIYSKNVRKVRFHVFLHFNARKHNISLFYTKWTKFTRLTTGTKFTISCEFGPLQVKW